VLSVQKCLSFSSLAFCLVSASSFAQINGFTGQVLTTDTVSVMFSPLSDGRPGGAICWIKVEDGSYKKPADGGCGARDPDNITRWEKWLEQGFSSSKEALAGSI